MRHRLVFATLATLLSVTAATAQPVYTQAPQPAPGSYAPPPAYPQPGYAPPPVIVQQEYCREYTDTFAIGAEVRRTIGTACLQPDGSWQVRSSNAGVNYVTRGGQLYIIPAQPFTSVVIVGDHHHHYHGY